MLFGSKLRIHTVATYVHNYESIIIQVFKIKDQREIM